jgi:cell wall-associated NlpC family hydrolase
MNHFERKAVKTLILSVGMTLLLTAAAMAGEVGSDVGAVTGSSVRMRAEASTSSSVITTLDKGVSVSILGSTDGWYKVSYSGSTGYISADYIVVDQDGVFTSYGSVNSDGVNVRSAASVDSSAVASLNTGAPLTVNGFSNGWYAVTCQYGTSGYIRSDFVNLTSSAPTDNSQIVSLAKNYLGTRYVYGGASPSGFDCSGFTMYVYSQFGVSLPHTATGQWQSGTGTKVYATSALQAGDLVFFCDPSRSNGKACSHAGIYIGNGKFIHASSASSGGVVISSLYEDYYATYYVGGKHVG